MLYSLRPDIVAKGLPIVTQDLGQENYGDCELQCQARAEDFSCSYYVRGRPQSSLTRPSPPTIVALAAG